MGLRGLLRKMSAPPKPTWCAAYEGLYTLALLATMPAYKSKGLQSGLFDCNLIKVVNSFGVAVDTAKTLLVPNAYHRHAVRDQKYDVIDMKLIAGDSVQEMFHEAACCGNAHLTRYFLSKGAKVDALDKADEVGTALDCAIRYRCIAAAKVLLQEGADPNQRSRRTRYSMLRAELDYDGQLITALLGAGVSTEDAKRDLRDWAESRTSATATVKLGAARFLLEALGGPSVWPDPAHLLFDLLARNRESALLRLVQIGFPLEGRDEAGMTLLLLAARGNRQWLVRMLLMWGVDITAKSPCGKTYDQFLPKKRSRVLVEAMDASAKRANTEQ